MHNVITKTSFEFYPCYYVCIYQIIGLSHLQLSTHTLICHTYKVKRLQIFTYKRAYSASC